MNTYSLDQPVPSSASVRGARDAYLKENDFDMQQYDMDWVPVNLFGLRVSIPNPRIRKLAVRYHDLHHLMTGYGTDEIGEVQISVWELKSGIRNFGIFVPLLIATQIILGLVHSPKTVLSTWKSIPTGRHVKKPSYAYYEACLKLTMGELRQAHGLPIEGIAGPRRLHGDAPKLS